MGSRYVFAVVGLGNRLVGAPKDHVGLPGNRGALCVVDGAGGDGRERLELSDPDGGHPPAGLTDIVEAGVQQSVVTEREVESSDEAGRISVDALWEGASGDLPEPVSEPVDARERRERVVDRRREGSYRNFDQLIDRQL